ncbi:DUF4186 domain-containing protein [Flexivirga meconopsidis]|uniref:DUF4186 domain-containing protein n=1 Tax=Flexivirga meconopsidis TaxID=2977121 RepID=UPI00223ECBFC|nr:DUF4186 domain-containing protein [Flexivirga meconopsidis]
MSITCIDPATIDARLAAIGRQPFRARFHLCPPEREFVAQRGMAVVRDHARDLIARRLAPAWPVKDGKQTPWGGHPVFRAQHATGTCCRSCLQRTHGIRKGHDLTPAEFDYVITVVCRWVALECGADQSAHCEA